MYDLNDDDDDERLLDVRQSNVMWAKNQNVQCQNVCAVINLIIVAATTPDE